MKLPFGGCAGSHAKDVS